MFASFSIESLAEVVVFAGLGCLSLQIVRYLELVGKLPAKKAKKLHQDQLFLTTMGLELVLSLAVAFVIKTAKGPQVDGLMLFGIGCGARAILGQLTGLAAARVNRDLGGKADVLATAGGSQRSSTDIALRDILS